VNDDVIMLSEFKEALKSAEKSDISISEEIILNEMINRMLLLNEAKKFWISVPGNRRKTAEDEGAIINEYINRRIKAFIYIPYEDIEYYYTRNLERFEDKEFYDVRDEIEDYLLKEEISIRLSEYIEELRKTSYIRIQLKEEN
jgi:hypothetical protein